VADVGTMELKTHYTLGSYLSLCGNMVPVSPEYPPQVCVVDYFSVCGEEKHLSVLSSLSLPESLVLLMTISQSNTCVISFSNLQDALLKCDYTALNCRLLFLLFS
jgi:hypothetical protein